MRPGCGSMTGYRFIIVDDHPLFRGALSQALADAFADAEVLQAGSLDELIQLLATAGEIDLILLDLTMPGVHGVSGLLYLRAQHPEVPVVIVSASDDASTIRQCLDCGASGFVPKSQPVEAMRDAGVEIDLLVASGGSASNRRWRQIHADVLGIPVAIPAQRDGVLLGSAMLAARATGLHSSLKTAMGQMNNIAHVATPDAAAGPFHDAKYAVYRRMIEDQRAYAEMMRAHSAA